MSFKHRLWAVALAVALLPGAAAAQVEKIELDIAGYLCGF